MAQVEAGEECFSNVLVSRCLTASALACLGVLLAPKNMTEKSVGLEMQKMKHFEWVVVSIIQGKMFFATL